NPRAQPVLCLSYDCPLLVLCNMKLTRVAAVGLLFIAARTADAQSSAITSGSTSNNAAPASDTSPTFVATSSVETSGSASKTAIEPESSAGSVSDATPAPIEDVIQAVIAAGATPEQV
ncbi:hypothetical protein SDRG_06825, partial [Saprolegnia diclina VS20]